MQTWLVTGARGFLGTNVGVALGGRAHLVGQGRTGVTSAVYSRMITTDLSDPAGITAAIRDIRPDVILHAAAISGHETCAIDPEQALAVNVVATRAIAAEASAVGARMIAISTDAVFAGDRGNYAEADPIEPFSYYGETKAMGEAGIRAELADHLIIRTNFFGWSETGRKSVLEFFVNSLRQGTAIRGYPDFVVTSIYVQSLIEAIWRLNEARATGTLHVASCDALSKYDYGVTIAREFGLDADLIARLGPPEGAHAASRSRNLSLCTDRAAGLLGSPLQSQEAGVAQARAEETTIGAEVRSA
jgi:dTDP-4-dehydrorhamnose reductase